MVHPSHKRARLGLISAVTNKGELRWMVLDGALKAASLIRFLGRLIQDANGKVFLIWDNLPVIGHKQCGAGWPSAMSRSRCSTCPPTVRS